MATRLQTFDPKQLFITWGGFILTGWAQDVIRVRYDTDAVLDESGADGETVRVLTNDLRAAITLSFQPTSKANDFMQRTGNADRLTGGGVLPFFARDTIVGGRDVMSAAQAWLSTWPEVIRRKGVEPQNWVLRTNNLSMLLRGSSQV